MSLSLGPVLTVSVDVALTIAGPCIDLAGDSYGMAEAEYERTMEPKIQKRDLVALV